MRRGCNKIFETGAITRPALYEILEGEIIMPRKHQYRQGDVLLVPLKKTPPLETVAREGNYSVLAEGEVTGHFHRMLHESSPMFLADEGRKAIVTCNKPTSLTHDEHDPINVIVGDYSVELQRTHAPNFTKTNSQVEALRVID